LARLPGVFNLPVDNTRSLVLPEGRTDFALPVSLVRLPAVLGPPPTRLTVQIEAAGLVAFSQPFTLTEAVDQAAECDCGKSVAGVFSCDGSGTGLGPHYNGSIYAGNYPRWDNVPGFGAVTDDERIIIVAVAGNEGGFDAVQAYDSEIVSVGFIQKTARKDLKEGGELAVQLHEFSQSHPDLYKCLLSDCGWGVRKIKSVWNIFYKKPASHKVYDGAPLFEKMREETRAAKVKIGKPVTSKMAAPFVRLGRNPAFQDKQVIDAVARLRMVLKLKPLGYDYTVADFLKTRLGRALALDEHVNKSSHVEPYLGEALDRMIKFYLDRKGVAVSKNPKDWGEERETYETKLIEIYGPLRAEPITDSKGTYRGGMTGGKRRYETLKSYFDAQGK